MAKILSIIIPVLIGSVIMVNGVLVKSDVLIASAKVAANEMNVHQLDNAIELYYSDHDHYPPVSGGEALTNLLLDENYIRNKPLDPSALNYESSGNNQNYSLTLVSEEI
jgi:hypothetical protein